MKISAIVSTCNQGQAGKVLQGRARQACRGFEVIAAGRLARNDLVATRKSALTLPVCP